jgi:hypothetical protein
MNDDLFERLVVAFESIAQSLVGINDTKQREFAKQWPEPRPIREAVVSRIPTEEDIIREAQGIDGKSLEEWLQIPGEDAEFIGERERAFLEEQKRNAGAKVVEVEGSGSGRDAEVGSYAK